MGKKKKRAETEPESDLENVEPDLVEDVTNDVLTGDTNRTSLSIEEEEPIVNMTLSLQETLLEIIGSMPVLPPLHETESIRNIEKDYVPALLAYKQRLREFAEECLT